LGSAGSPGFLGYAARKGNASNPMSEKGGQSANSPSEPVLLYCPKCAAEVTDPLTCGDCGAVICRQCGTPLESADELGIA